MSNKVKMELPEQEATNEVAQEEQKYSYDDLYKIAQRLSASNAELQQRLNQMALGNFFTRLEFLFKVVKYSEKFPDDFVKKCVDEIVGGMTVEEGEKEVDKEN